MQITISRNKVHIVWAMENDTIFLEDGVGGVFVQAILSADTIKAMLHEMDAQRTEIEALKGKEEVEKEEREEKRIQQLQDIILAGKRDPQSKRGGGFIVIEQNGTYSYRVAGGIPDNCRLVMQWRWNGRMWQSY